MELVEQFIREYKLKRLQESPSAASTGGLIGKRFAELCIQQEKSILELLKLATADVRKDIKINPQYIGKENRLINIYQIQDLQKRKNALNQWINEATEIFLKKISKVRILNKNEQALVRNYFADIVNQQPLKGREDYV